MYVRFEFAKCERHSIHTFQFVRVCGVHACDLYHPNEQLREVWAQVACMMLVPGCEGIGTLTEGLERVGTMRWVEPSNVIDHARWAEFVRANFMWTFLLMQARSDAKAGSAAYTALARLAAPLNGAPYHGIWETSVGMDPKTCEEMGWPQNSRSGRACKARRWLSD